MFALEIALDAVSTDSGCGRSTEFDVDRHFRDAPL
jgi:hypothetical protein